MFEDRARKEGQQDGRADAELERPRRPRPSLALSLLSERYRDEYLTNYKRAYERQQSIIERAHSQKFANDARLTKGKNMPKDKRFEQGWRDGFAGIVEPPRKLTHDDLRAYERGHRFGAQHRDYERANQLRQAATQKRMPRRGENSR